MAPKPQEVNLTQPDPQTLLQGFYWVRLKSWDFRAFQGEQDCDKIASEEGKSLSRKILWS